ncbi:MAG TPA: ankyrin repeat domain-containing protein [Spirochaetia bacterium]|nr:ankyrin repeat domain-containing protein [Spirochaetia bacterium]
MKALASHSISARGVTVADAWIDGGGVMLRSRLQDSTHIVLVPDGLPPAAWVTYLLGYAEGARIPVCAASSESLPSAFSGVAVVAPAQVESHMLAERSKWLAASRVVNARLRLQGRETDPGAFCAAAANGDRQAVEDFLVVGHSPDTRSLEGVPVLVCAIRGRSVEIVQRLLGEGADPTATCGNDGASALCEAASMGLGTIVGVLLANGADPNQETGNGQTALMLASSQGHREVVDHLLLAHADALRRDSLGMSARDYARLFGRAEILGTLEKLNPS